MKDARANLKKSLTRGDSDTFLTTLSVMMDAFCQVHRPPEPRGGAPASLTRSAGLTLALWGQWPRFPSERGCYRYPQRPRRGAVPTWPARSQVNRRLRPQPAALGACNGSLVQRLPAQHGADEALEATAVPTRDATRRGLGWLPGGVDIGWSHRLGW